MNRLTSRQRVLLLAAAAAAIAGGALYWTQRTKFREPVDYLSRLPTGDATIVAVDFGVLRRAGVLSMLAGSNVEAEPEYTAFVRETGFDFARDLDQAYVSFPSRGSFFLLRGRFDWTKFEKYARAHGGVCFNSLCRMPGSTAERSISFYPAERSVMALAVSGDEWAASRMNEPARDFQVVRTPSEPLWLWMPAAAMRRAESFPTGTQLFAKAMQDTEGFTLSVDGQGSAFEARIEVLCRSEQQAVALEAGLQKISSVLKAMVEKEGAKPGPGDLAGVLMRGSFRQDGRRVLGHWPLDRAFLESLAGKS